MYVCFFYFFYFYFFFIMVWNYYFISARWLPPLRINKLKVKSKSVSFCVFSKYANSVIIELKRGLFKSPIVPLYNFVSYESNQRTCSWKPVEIPGPRPPTLSKSPKLSSVYPVLIYDLSLFQYPPECGYTISYVNLVRSPRVWQTISGKKTLSRVSRLLRLWVRKKFRFSFCFKLLRGKLQERCCARKSSD